MKFQYHNPINFQFGTDVYEQIPDLCSGRKVMLVYGGGSIKSNDVYDKITSLLREHNIPYIDYGNQTAANYQDILDGIALAKRENIGSCNRNRRSLRNGYGQGYRVRRDA